MLKKISLLFVATMMLLGVWSNNFEKAAYSLAERIINKSKAQQIKFKQKDADKDFFELKSERNNIVITANNVNSMAMGLGHYIRYCCNQDISWENFSQITLPDTLPRIEKTICREARVEDRFFLNYCTFGYTTVWWQWKEWEYFIDWMALNGINMPLACCGQEAIWYRIWRKHGLSDSQIRAYFTGPAHLPWHRMINMDKWQGMLPKSWLKEQEKLQSLIVKRERELGMKPILPAFAGHVPEALKEIYPNAKITRNTSWGGFKDTYRSFFLSPQDSLFSIIQKESLEEQEKLYGTDHLYAIDPFNEVDPPSWEENFLRKTAETIYNSVAHHDPKAVWIQMTWLFYIDQSHWQPQKTEAFLNGVDKDKLLLLDYYAEDTEVWRKTNSYYDHKFIWCYLGNFGGNTMLAGNFKETSRRIENALKETHGLMNGIGSTLEGLDCNPLMYEFVLDKAWTPLYSEKQWIDKWADRRLECADKRYRQAWQLLVDSVYTTPARLGQATLTNSRPTFKGKGNWTTNPKINYNNEILSEVWRLMMTAVFDNNNQTEAALYDCVNIARQYLGNKFSTLRDSMTDAYIQRDILKFKQAKNQMLDLLKDINEITALHPAFSFDRWINLSQSHAKNNEQKEYYRQSATTLLTTWGETPQSLNDYASRTWSGLVEGYYARRWKMFLDMAEEALQNNKEFNNKEFTRLVTEFEKKVSRGEIIYQSKKDPSPFKKLRMLYNKHTHNSSPQNN